MPTSEPRTTEVDDHAGTAAVCAACPHPWEEHDPLGVRFCAATTASALPRGCICG
ncbi:RGCVC family protein [Lentzea sp. BCCO 10_0856]|uniref:RGCVC family protein n=1 Tax=Lentzea miocenica TaxID=3095431 RepID=A0ABU4T7W2_9PSEU|nr:RGCVC family protein [Lentzea sp. BCCO 10_0856]MDX8034047.1 RGCVC family protein [Lentzea sp. BCCO 10_0856]